MTTQVATTSNIQYLSPVDTFHSNNSGRYYRLYVRSKENYRLYDAHKDQIFDQSILYEILEELFGTPPQMSVVDCVWKSLQKLDSTLDNFSKPFGVYKTPNKTGLATDTVFNTYRSPMSDKAVASDGKLWFEYLDRIFPDKNQQSTMLDWLAHAFQHSEIRPLWGVVLYGEQRCGKSTLMDILRRIVGTDYVETTNKYNVLNSKFHSTLATKFFAGFEDLTPLVDNNDFKQFMTQPTAPLEHKGKDKRQVHCQCRIIHTTNNDPFFVAGTLGGGETRYFIPDGIKHKASPSESEHFFSQFYEWLDNGGDAFIAHYLKTHEISDSFSIQSPLLTPTFQRWANSEHPLIAEVKDYLSDKLFFRIDDLKNSLDPTVLYDNASPTLVTVLGDLGYESYRTPKIKNRGGKEFRLWHKPSEVSREVVVKMLRSDCPIGVMPDYQPIF